MRHAYDRRKSLWDATHLIEAGVDLLEVQKILGHRSILTTIRYAPQEVPLGDTHLTDQTKHHAIDRINRLMDSFTIDWGKVK